jgi:hypothetical protein
MAAKKHKKIKVQDLKPKKDAKGGVSIQQHGVQSHGVQSRGVQSHGTQNHGVSGGGGGHQTNRFI